MIDGHLYRPGSGVLKDKTKTGPKQAFLPNKPFKGTPRKEQASDRRGVQRSATSPPSDKPQGYTGSSGGGAPGGRPPGKGPPGGNGDDGDNDHQVMMMMMMMKTILILDRIVKRGRKIS